MLLKPILFGFLVSVAIGVCCPAPSVAYPMPVDEAVLNLKEQLRHSHYCDGQIANNLATAYLEEQEWNDAIDATFLAPFDKDRHHLGLLYCTRARAYASLNDIDAANRELSMATFLLPRGDGTVVKTAELVATKEKAVTTTDSSKSKSPEKIHDVLKAEAEARRFMRERNYSGVIAVTTEALTEWPNDSEILLSRAEAFDRLKRFDEAIQDYKDQVRRSYYKDGLSANKLAIVYLEKQEWYDAIEATFLAQVVPKPSVY